jgi:hypothetical protein
MSAPASQHRIPSLSCPEGCEDGVIEVIDSSRVHSATIDPPYIQTACPECDDGEVYEWTCGACDESFHTTEQMPVNPESAGGWVCAVCAFEEEGLDRMGRHTAQLLEALEHARKLALHGKHSLTPLPSEVQQEVSRARDAREGAWTRMHELATHAYSQSESAS